MKVARLQPGAGKLSIEELEEPKLGRRDVLVKVRSAGVCHTDLHFLDGTIPMSESITLGHEIAGDVAKVGTEVAALKPHDRVIVNNCMPCQACHPCRQGWDNLCDNLVQVGFNADGGYAEFVKVREDSVFNLPESLSYEVGAALTCGVASCYHALIDIAKLSLEDIVLINGMGGLGFSALQLAKLSGATTIAVDIVPEKLERAEKEFGADHTINGMQTKVAPRVKEITKGKGVDIVLELVGSQKTMNYDVEVLSKHGRLVFVGYSKADFTVNPLSLVLKEARVLASVAYRKSNLLAVRELSTQGKIKPLIAGKYKLEDINKAFDDLKAGKLVGRPMIIL